MVGDGAGRPPWRHTVLAGQPGASGRALRYRAGLGQRGIASRISALATPADGHPGGTGDPRRIPAAAPANRTGDRADRGAAVGNIALPDRALTPAAPGCAADDICDVQPALRADRLPRRTPAALGC